MRDRIGPRRDLKQLIADDRLLFEDRLHLAGAQTVRGRRTLQMIIVAINSADEAKQKP